MAKKKVAATEASEKKRGAPQKECPKCHQQVHARVAKCPNCEYEFPKPEKASKPERKRGPVVVGVGETKKSDDAFSLACQLVEKAGGFEKAKEMLDQMERVRDLVQRLDKTPVPF